MNQIRSLGLIVCVLMVLMAYLKQAIPKGKITYLMKAIISIFILLSLIDGIKGFDLNSLKNLMGENQNNNVMNEATMVIEQGLKDEFNRFLKEQNIDATVERISVGGDGYEILRVVLSGADAEGARRIIAGRYQVGISNIEVKYEYRDEKDR